MIGVLAAPRAALDLKEMPHLRLFHLVDVHEELRILVADMPAQTILFDGNLARRLEVFAIKAQGVSGRRKEAAARERHIMLHFILAFLSEQGQA